MGVTCCASVAWIQLDPPSAITRTTNDDERMVAVAPAGPLGATWKMPVTARRCGEAAGAVTAPAGGGWRGGACRLPVGCAEAGSGEVARAGPGDAADVTPMSRSHCGRR